MSSNRTSELRSGGKMVRTKRRPATRTPYDRPPPRELPFNSSAPPENPNWLSRFILSPTRMFVSGAGKVLSVLRDDPDCSSSDSELASDGDIDDYNDGISQDDDKSENSSMRGIDPPAIEWKTETKRAIERLLMEETFSREECERLTYIIKTRVVDPPTTPARLTDIPATTVSSDADLPALCSTAVTEAKKWLEEKKLGSKSKSPLEYGTCTPSPAVLPHVAEGEAGSPVDLAKSYMQARPSWASPAMNNFQSLSPSLAGTQHFKEETPYSLGGNSLSTSKLIRDSSATGSWNIQEEIRKVRSRETENLLRTRPSLLSDWSALPSDYKKSPELLIAYKAEAAQHVLVNESSVTDPATSIPEENQDLRVAETNGVEDLGNGSDGKAVPGQRCQPSENVKAGLHSGADGLTDANEEHQHLNFTVEGDIQNSRSLEINCSTSEAVAGKDSVVAANGFPSGSSTYDEQERDQKSKLSNEQQISIDSGDHEKETENPIANETASIEVHIVNDSDTAATGSQNSSSMQHEGLSQKSPKTLKRRAGKSSAVKEPQKQNKGIEKQKIVKRKYAARGKGQVKIK